MFKCPHSVIPASSNSKSSNLCQSRGFGTLDAKLEFYKPIGIDGAKVKK